MRTAESKNESIRKSIALVLIWSAAVCVGCGELPAPQPPAKNGTPTASGNSPTAAGKTDSSPKQPAVSAKSAPNQLVRVDERGQKWFGDIPYDVWFDDPLATAGDLKEPAPSAAAPTAPGPSESTPATDKPTPVADTKPKSPDAADGAKTDWEQLAPVDVIDAETKSVRNRITQSMQTVGTFNGKYKEIQSDAATLAALAGIVGETSSAISWREQAPTVRDLAAQIEEAANALGKPAYDATQKPYDQLITVLDGGKPVDAAKAEAQVDFAQRANRSGVMRRMNSSFTWLKQNVGKADELASKSGEAGHEISLIALLAGVIAHKSYDSSEEEVYRKEAAGMIEAAQQARKSVDTMNFAEFQNSFNRVQQHCDRCHAEYRFGNE